MNRQILLFISCLILYSCQSPSSESPSSEPEVSMTEQEPAVFDSFLVRHESEILAFEKADQVRMPVSMVCLFTGSSSVRLWRDLEGDLKPLPVINRGFGGSTFRELNYYFDRIVLPYRPKMVVVYEGDNDIVNPEVSPEDVLAELDRFRRLRDQKLPWMKIFMMAVKPSPSRRVIIDKARETNSLFESYADTADNVWYLDTFSPIMTSSGKINGSFFTGDSLHMNDNGYQVWTEEILEPLLEAYAQ